MSHETPPEEVVAALGRDHSLVSQILLALMLDRIRGGAHPLQAPLAERERLAAAEAEKHRKLVAAKASELLDRQISAEHPIIAGTFPRLDHEAMEDAAADPVMRHYRDRLGCGEFAAILLTPPPDENL